MKTLICALLLLPIYVSAQLNSEQLYKQVSDSVVFISDFDSQGSGVVLTADGYILTNYHVVASGLPFSVKATVSSAGRKSKQTFSDLRVEKIHKSYDLALIKLDLKGKKLIPVRRLKDDDKVAPSSECYAIGNPDGLVS